MQPLQEVAVGIYKRLFLNYHKTIDGASWKRTQKIRKGNKLAHDRNVLTDNTVIRHGDLNDTVTFCDIYGLGVLHENAQLYLSMYTFIIVVGQEKYTGTCSVYFPGP